MSENTGKTAIVTGASRGIGKAIAIRLAKSGL
jgi:short chain dehydrogenase.